MRRTGDDDEGTQRRDNTAGEGRGIMEGSGSCRVDVDVDMALWGYQG
jgi:hypothetical protein